MKSHRLRIHVMLAGTLLAIGGRVHAQVGAPVVARVTVDEFGHGFAAVGGGPIVPLAATIAPDPGPGGLGATLTYAFPAGVAVVPGDVLMHDANEPRNPFFDVLRFNFIGGVSTLVFYSDNVDGADAPADTPSPPTAFYPNLVNIQEIGPEGSNGAIYTPGPNDPGFIAGAAVTYNFVSDGVIPEPATVVLLGGGLLGLGIVARRRRA